MAAFRRVANVARYITYHEALKAAPEGSHPNTSDLDMQRRSRAVAWTDQSQVYANFHLERGKPYWVITIDQSIKTLNYVERIAEMEALVYRVNDDGRTCLIQASNRRGKLPDHLCLH